MQARETSYTLPNPNEEKEQNRLDYQHQAWLLSFDGSLKAPGLPADFQPSSVLDVGCGSGVWATSYAIENPQCQVVAFDIKPPSMIDCPPNLTIMSSPVDVHAHDQWPEGKFDYIHVRMLHLVVRDWHSLFQICWHRLNAGGWLEINDSTLPLCAENKSANVETSMVIRFGCLLEQIEREKGIDANASIHNVDRFGLHGFTNISRLPIKWPLNGLWPQDNKSRQIGTLTGINFLQFSKYWPVILANQAHLDPQRAADFCDRVVDEIQADRNMRYYVSQAATIGQKPSDEPDKEATKLEA